ncbi:MAG: thioredoxin [Anaerovoracaceae bacterium]
MEVIKLNSANFEAEVLKSDVPVLVDFFATWCGPCKMVAPVLEEIAAESKGGYKIAKIDVDEENAVAMKYGVMSMPTFMVFKNGEVAEKVVGARPKAEILALLK